jgi:hypothetical protein
MNNPLDTPIGTAALGIVLTLVLYALARTMLGG